MDRIHTAACGLALMMTLCGGAALAQDETRKAPEPVNTAHITKAVAPYLTEQTVFVGYLDAARVDLPGFTKWWGGVADRVFAGEHNAEIAQIKFAPMVAEVFRAQFVVAGGRHVYVTFSLPEVIAEPMPLVVVPVEPGGNVDRLLEAVPHVQAYRGETDPGRLYKVARGDVVLIGSGAALSAIVNGRDAATRPELAEALAAVEGRAARAVLIPTKDMRRVIDEMMPNLPARLGGEPTTTFTRGIQWMAVGVDVGASPRFVLVDEAATPQHAKALHVFVRGLPDLAAHLSAGHRGLSEDEKVFVEMLRQAVKLLPEPRGTTIRMELDQQKLDDAAMTILGPAMQSVMHAREKALATQSATQIRQIVTVCFVYANDHQGRLPDSLAQLVKAGLIDKRLVEDNPRNLTDKRAYVYLKPGVPLSKIKDTGKTALVYEAYDNWPKLGCNIGFVDGHVECIADEAEFKRIIGQQPQE